MYDQDQIVENYSRLRNDFKFQKINVNFDINRSST